MCRGEAASAEEDDEPIDLDEFVAVVVGVDRVADDSFMTRAAAAAEKRKRTGMMAIERRSRCYT